jgi:hypothetical protein
MLTYLVILMFADSVNFVRKLTVLKGIFFFSTIAHNYVFIMYITIATCFGLFYRAALGTTLYKTQICIPSNIISELTDLHVNCNSCYIHKNIVILMYITNILFYLYT